MPSTSDLEQDVYPPRVKRIHFADKTYTSYGENVYVSGLKRIHFADKTYTSYGENVYVSGLKRIRLGHETYTFCPDKVYVSLIPIASRMLKAILLPRRNPEHHYEEKSYVTMPRGGFSAVKAVFLS